MPMKLTIGQADLERALSVAGRAVATNTTAQVLAGVLMRAKGGELELQGTNLTSAVRTRADAEVAEEGETVLSARVLASVVKSLPDAPVTIECDGSRTSVVCGRSRFSLAALPAGDFPEFPEPAVSREATLPRALMQEMAAKVCGVASKEQTRPLLQGVQVTIDEGSCRMVATDGYRIVVCEGAVAAEPGAEPIVAVMPATALKEALALREEASKVRLLVADTQVALEVGHASFVTRRLEGAFPNWRMLVPADHKTAVTLPAAALAQTLRRVGSVASKEAAVRLQVDVAEGALEVSARDNEAGEAAEALGAASEGEGVTIGFKLGFFQDALAVCGDADEVGLELSGAQGPAVFRSYADVRCLQVLMPVRL